MHYYVAILYSHWHKIIILLCMWIISVVVITLRILIAWCFYYFAYFLLNDLPLNVDESNKIWDDLQVYS